LIVYLIVAGPLADFHVLELAVFDTETEGGAYQVETLDTGGTGVEHHHVVVFVVDHFQDVGVTADEDPGPVRFNQAQGPVVVVAGIAADMGHQHAHPVLLEVAHHLGKVAHVVAVAVAEHTDQWLEGGDLRVSGLIAEITRMPDHVDRRQKVFQLLVEVSVGVGNQPDICHDRLDFDNDLFAVEPHGHADKQCDIAEGEHQRGVFVVAAAYGHAAGPVEPVQAVGGLAVGRGPVDHAAEDLHGQARHDEAEERVHAHGLEGDEGFLVALDVDEIHEERQAEDGPAARVQYVRSGPQRLADGQPDAPDAAQGQADGRNGIELGHDFHLVVRVPDGLADEIAQQHCAGAGQRTEQPFRVEGDAIAVVHMVFSHKRDVDFTRDIAFQRRPARLRAEHIEDQPVEAGYARNAPENLPGCLEEQRQEAAQHIAHGNALQHAEHAVMLDPVHPVLAKGPAGVVGRGGVEGEEVQARAHQEDEDAALDQFPGALLVEGVAVFGEGKGHRHADAEQEEREHQVGRRAAGPGCMFEGREDMGPAAGVVDQDHPGHRHAPQHIKGDISLGLRLCHNVQRYKNRSSFREKDRHSRLDRESNLL